MEKSNAQTKILAMREQQEKEAKIKKFIQFAVAGLLVVCVVIAGVLIYNNAPKVDPVVTSDAEKPNGLTPTGSFMVDENGGVADPDTRKETGKIRVQTLFDPMCPGCGIVDRTLNDRLLELVKSGEITLQATPLAFLDDTSSDRYSTRAANAITTVANDSPEQFFAFVAAIFENQPEEGDAYVPVTDEDFAKLAESVGVSPAVTATFKDEKYSDWVSNNTVFNINRKDLFGAQEFSTPVIFIGGSETEDGVVKDALRVDWASESTIEESFENTLKQAKGE